MKITYFLFMLFLAFPAGVFAQNESQVTETGENGTIQEQFEYLKEISSNYQEYKVIKRAELDRLQATILDSTQRYQNEIQELNSALTETKNQITQLNGELSETKEELARAIEERDSFSIFGLLLHKQIYNNLVWGVILFLLLVLIVSFIQFKRGHKITAETQRTLEDLREEFEQHRRNTLERERKLNRQLVDALNNKDS
ncbi:hypothetical protein [Cyclobacterium jeungdonense]|uniref:tRNA (Guanine-N1)-methyltransferase n=1 Tax=Cyclobacterium jeungdonense TaxID=708087 RepID=A0ABT8C0U8_9BACT|nr:hypothetical protein [Cyclobacterium jeungdonense]MDN3686419.1 hypothetical protein [Cyclobacterium jeungdonense]